MTRWKFWLLLVWVVLIFIAPLIRSTDPMLSFAGATLTAPNEVFPLGTDFLGRDVLSRVLDGGQRTLLMSVGATLLAMIAGLLFASLRYLLIIRFELAFRSTQNTWLAIPGLFFALILLTLWGSGWWQISVAIGISQAAGAALVANTNIIAQRDLPYIGAAQSLGATRTRILLQHLLPNIRQPLLSYAGVVFAYSILTSAALGFLGFGGELGVPEWGVLLAEGQNSFRTAPWVAIAPGVCIIFTVWLVNDLVDILNHPSDGSLYL